MDVFLFTASAAAFRAYLLRRCASSSSAGSSGVSPRKLSLALLQRQDAETSSSIIAHYSANERFLRLASYEGYLCLERDREDDLKLQHGIEYAKQKGVVDPKYKPEPYVQIDVLGKTPSQVAEIILQHVYGNARKKQKKSQSGSEKQEGSVIVLVGLSGTGKGTTVSELRRMLESDRGTEVVTWSNGNIFRSFTLLAVTWCEQHCKGGKFDPSKALAAENLSKFSSMLSFDERGGVGRYDTRIHGLGLDLLVSEVQNTQLKSPKVAKNIPTVAEKTQGEVITFAAQAVEKLRLAGKVVLLEGREQTVDYVRTPYRFALTLSDESLIGKRRAAQRIMAGALSKLEKDLDADDLPIEAALDSTLQEMVHEMEQHQELSQMTSSV